MFTSPPRLAQAWVVDIPDQRHITTMLKYVSIGSPPLPLSCPFISTEDG
jgi:hypothetical protein